MEDGDIEFEDDDQVAQADEFGSTYDIQDTIDHVDEMVSQDECEFSNAVITKPEAYSQMLDSPEVSTHIWYQPMTGNSLHTSELPVPPRALQTAHQKQK